MDSEKFTGFWQIVGNLTSFANSGKFTIPDGASLKVRQDTGFFKTQLI